MHRLVVVDESDVVVGIISLSDLLMFLVLRATGECDGGSLREAVSIGDDKNGNALIENVDQDGNTVIEGGDKNGNTPLDGDEKKDDKNLHRG